MNQMFSFITTGGSDEGLEVLGVMYLIAVLLYLIGFSGIILLLVYLYKKVNKRWGKKGVKYFIALLASIIVIFIICSEVASYLNKSLG